MKNTNLTGGRNAMAMGRVYSLCGVDMVNNRALVCGIETETIRGGFKVIDIMAGKPSKDWMKQIYGLYEGVKGLMVSGDSSKYPGVGTERTDAPKIVLLAKIIKSSCYLTYTTPLAGPPSLTLLDIYELSKLAQSGYSIANGVSGLDGMYGIGSRLPHIGDGEKINEYRERFRGYKEAAAVIANGSKAVASGEKPKKKSAPSRYAPKVVHSLCGLDMANKKAMVCDIDSENLGFTFNTIDIWPSRPEVRNIYGLSIPGVNLKVNGNPESYPGIGTQKEDWPKIVLLAKIRLSDYYLTYTTPLSNWPTITLLEEKELFLLNCFGYEFVNFALGAGGPIGIGNIPKVGYSAHLDEYKEQFRGYAQATMMLRKG